MLRYEALDLDFSAALEDLGDLLADPLERVEALALDLVGHDLDLYARQLGGRDLPAAATALVGIGLGGLVGPGPARLRLGLDVARLRLRAEHLAEHLQRELGLVARIRPTNGVVTP